MADLRPQLGEFLREELVGPLAPDEELRDSPTQRYSAGILFPRQQSILEDEETTQMPRPREDDANAGDADRVPMESSADDETIVMASSYFPGAMGLTFAVDTVTPAVRVGIQGARYVSEQREQGEAEQRRVFRVWCRRPLELEPLQIELGSSHDDLEETIEVVDGLGLRVRARPAGHDGVRLVTLALHTTRSAGSRRPSASECFFQMGFDVEALDGALRAVESKVSDLEDDEEASLALMYRKRLAYATGHGCAAGWDVEPGALSARRIWTETISSIRIPPVQPRAVFDDAHSMQFLSGDGVENPDVAIPNALSRVVDTYEAWVAERRQEVDGLEARLEERARHHLELCELAIRRMRQGLALLSRDVRVRDAFMLANRAILEQQYHVRRSRRAHDGIWEELPTHYVSRAGEAGGGIRGYWRSFQIMFVLMNLDAALDPDDPEIESFIDEVDLIWFPTGGGKTEAYLGLAAYMIFMKRLTTPEHRGCHVLMRYTLRLLTAQQFQRACGMICACERIRQQRPGDLGDTPITIGLWVGRSLTPNKRKDAIAGLVQWKREPEKTENAFQLLTCPWCGTALDDPTRSGYQVGGWPETVQLVCPEPRCTFSTKDNPLPVVVIDEDLYATPATLIIGTVDKFAMLAWRDDASRLLGNGEGLAPPGLIIQDELHLISGPLGTMVGLYESMIEYICRHNGGRPKIVASTATIRRAQEQCKALYDREAQLFPPSGLDASDNFFAIEQVGERAESGREYVGVMCTAAPSPITALVRSAASLLQGIRSVELPSGVDEVARDPWWTLVMYFNALRELGRAATLVEGDIPEYLTTLQRRRGISGEGRRYTGPPVELTSRRTAQEIPEILERLATPWDPAASSSSAYDTLLATNMIAVGVDVDRLGLMLVVGQPKTTSEYIQASSRVGRSGDAPGLVVTLYNPGKPRDRSHYEHFWDYHQSFYRHVEPTSVTPFSPQAVERVARALLVIAARHVVGLADPTGINRGDVQLIEALDFLRDRARDVDPDHAAHFAQHLEEVLDEWTVNRVPPAEWGGFGDPPVERPLMYPAGSQPRPEWGAQAWAVPTSMRNVDASCIGYVTQVYPNRDKEQV